MKFLVMSEREIEKYNVKDVHIIISVKSPKSNKAIIPYRPNCLEILYLEFYDLDKDTGQFPYDRFLFDNIDAKKVWEFVNVYKDKISLIICQCEAGISRSAGIAGALSKVLNGDDTEFFKRYLPNMLVYKTILNEGGKMKKEWGYKITLSFGDKKDPKRINRISKLIGKIWRKNPDLRLMQLLENCRKKHFDYCMYYMEDEELEQRLKEVYLNVKPYTAEDIEKIKKVFQKKMKDLNV